MSNPLVSRGLMGLAAAILAGGASMGFLLLSYMYPDSRAVFLACFTPLPLYLAGLGIGPFGGVLASLAGTLILYFTPAHSFGVIYILLFAVPAASIIRLALRYRTGDDGKTHWYPDGKLLAGITLYPCALFLLSVAAAWSHEGGLMQMTRDAFNQHATEFAARFPNDQPEAFHYAVDVASTIVPAFASYMWILLTLFSVVGAQRILSRNKWNLRDNFSLLTLHVPVYMIYGVALFGLAGALAPDPYGYVGRNVAMIMGLPLFFVGLAVIHSFFNTLKYSVLFLIAFYVVLVYAPWIALLITALGAVDQWVDFRQRLIARKTTV